MFNTAQELAKHIHKEYCDEAMLNSTEAIAALINAYVLHTIDKLEAAKRFKDRPEVTNDAKTIQPVEINGIMVETKRVNVMSRGF